MTNLKFKYLVVAILIGNVSFAQEITREVQNLVNNLAKEGYKKFRLEKGPFTGLRLIAEDQGEALELILDRETQEVIKTLISFDDNNDGKISTSERRNGISLDKVPENAAERKEAVKNAKAQKKIEPKNKEKDTKEKTGIKKKILKKTTGIKKKTLKKTTGIKKKTLKKTTGIKKKTLKKTTGIKKK